jgi:hypothetical protein
MEKPLTDADWEQLRTEYPEAYQDLLDLLPNVADGLTAVQRNLLWTLAQKELHSDGPMGSTAEIILKTDIKVHPSPHEQLETSPLNMTPKQTAPHEKAASHEKAKTAPEIRHRLHVRKITFETADGVPLDKPLYHYE